MLGKSLHHCFSRFRRPSSPAPSSIQNPLHVPSSSSSSIVFKNFNSLFDPSASSDSETLITASSTSQTQTLTSSSSSDGEPETLTLSSAIAARRLLPARPGRSNSIIDDSAAAVGGGIAVATFSPDPYWDFRRSMEEMVAALGIDHPRGAHRARLHELLLCYLALNRKHAHKYIVGAFADLLRTLSDGGSAGDGGDD